MKQKIIIAALVLAGTLWQHKLWAQEDSFGVTSGMLHNTARTHFEGRSVESGASFYGYYLGLTYQHPFSEKLALETELDYGYGNHSNMGFLSARAKYYLIPKLSLQAGLQYSKFFEDWGDNNRTGGLGASFGLGYDIVPQLEISGRYTWEFTNRFKNDIADDNKYHYNWLQLGLTYKF